MPRTVVLAGNGLSVALNLDFALPNITRRFFDRLKEEHKAFIEHFMGDHYNQLDFEESIASIEQAYDSLEYYNKFISNQAYGTRFSQAYGLNVEELQKHIEAIKNVIHEYTASILDLIDGNVQKAEIEERLSGFVSWINFLSEKGGEIDFFTLNFDLLMETILLENIGTDNFTDFHYRGDRWSPIDNKNRYYFNPDRSVQIAGHRPIRLHHLHGSLSSFKHLDDGRLFKITTESLRSSKLYDNLFDLNIIPSIVTGGGKSVKVQQAPFSFYYNEFKKTMFIEEELCDELIIIGYSFRDDHINDAINERLQLSRRRENPLPLKITIVDYATTDDQKSEFIARINQSLQLGTRTKGRFVENDDRILFNGANSVTELME
ncbi:SIR2-like protein [Paenibacillus pabuli]|uniref:SIR2-like protein n=1 Tax=Paenibacillus pabuli TaxID=1472 RepID=A0ABX9BDR8_9BACL|nr:SIR2 family protein [Paenibacillus pabuli]RAI88120.1 SIR2-like protein [Paenibacillus pabuli]